MARLAKRLEKLPPYLFAEIDKAKARAQASGLDVVSMGIGDPDIDPPEWARGLLAEEVMRSGNHHYPSYKGRPELWEAALRFLERRYGVSGLGHEHILTTIGSKEAIANLAYALMNPDDCFICPDPCYPVFGNIAGLLGCTSYELPLHPGNNFMPKLADEINEDRARRARVMCVNYPHNPTGATATREYMAGLVSFAREHDIVLVSDMAYAELYFDQDNPPPSLLEFEGALDCVIEFHSFSKSFNMTGWRLGFAVGNQQLIGGLGTMKSNVDSGAFDAIQLAMARVLDDPRCDPFLNENRAFYERRLNKVCTALDELGLKYYRPGASIFIWCEIPNGERDSMAWCSRLLESTGVVVSPGAGFGEYGEGFFRLSLTTPEDTIDQALERLAAFLR